MNLLRHTLRNGGNGTALHTDNFTGKTMLEYDLVQCCHCQHTYKYKPGSGIRRGFCTLCNWHTCGKPVCDTHYYKEQYIEDLEAVGNKSKKQIEAAVRLQALRERIWSSR